MQLSEFLSLFLFIAVSIPAAILAKFRTLFPVGCKKKTVVCLPYSHFCEKVFWAYDRSKVPYDVRPVFQGFFPTTLLEFSASSVPIVVDPQASPRESVVIKDSKDALKLLYGEGPSGKWLYPDIPFVVEMEKEFGDAFGKAVARIVYHHLFSCEKGAALMKRIWKVDVTFFEQLLTEPLYPACRWAMLSVMDLPQGLRGFEAAVDRIFDKVSELLKDGRRYLCADAEHLTVADLTFASLAYPLVLPVEKERVFLSWETDDLPEGFRAEVRKRRESRAGQFVLRLYRDERNL